MNEKQGRSDEQRRVVARRWLFVDQGPFLFFVALLAFSPSDSGQGPW